jgi:hypothetical protein
MTTFLKATLVDGTIVISEFSKLEGSGQRYAGQVMAGQKPFNAWKIVGHQHPVSGEPALLRTRVMLSGAKIAQIEAVTPTTEQHNFDPVNFEPVVEVQGGRYGTYTVKGDEGIEGVPTGTKFPIHRDDRTLVRYVILKVAQGTEGTEGFEPEKRFLLDSRRVVSVGVDDVIGSETHGESGTEGAPVSEGGVATAEGPSDADFDTDDFDDDN